MRIKIIVLMFIIFILLPINVMGSGRRDSFNVVNKRWSKISVEVAYMNPVDIYHFESIFSYNGIKMRVYGNNHIYEGYNFINGRLSHHSSKKIYNYRADGRIIDEDRRLTGTDFIDSIPLSEQIKNILKELIIKDRKANILLTLEDITDDMIKGGNGYLYIEIK
jgi:hypothetical protein